MSHMHIGDVGVFALHEAEMHFVAYKHVCTEVKRDSKR